MKNWKVAEEEVVEEYDIEACNGSVISSNRSRISPSFHRKRAFIRAAIDSFSRKYLSCNKLHSELLRLTILKLDGTWFEIEVSKNGTVAELKQAVEGSFSHLPKKGNGMVSWSHVWGHFCLYYDGKKLLSDTDHISIYGITENDQLQFIRHVSINDHTLKMRSERDNPNLDEPSTSNSCENGQYNTVEHQCDANVMTLEIRR